MNILDVVSTCNSRMLSVVLPAVKNIMTIIQIVAPILLIIMSVVELARLTANPDDKKGVKKIINKILAAVIIFFIPVFINVVMGLVGENTNFSSCWNNAADVSNTKTSTDPVDDSNDENKDTYKPGDLSDYQ